MDDDVVSELESIMRAPNPTADTKATARLIQYISTLPSVDQCYVPVLQRFTDHAFSLLPASSLPAIVAQKFGLSICRKRRVSFGSTEIRHILSRAGLSREGECQRRREAGSLNLTNTDPSKNFRPKPCFEKGSLCETVLVPFANISVENTWVAPQCSSGVQLCALPHPIGDIIANPELLDAYR